MLDSDARAYWDKRNVIGRPRHAYFTDGFYRHGMMGRFIGIAHVVARLAGIDLRALLTGDIDAPERMEALDRLHRLFHSRLVQLLTRTPALLFSLGIPPRQRALLGGDVPLNEVLHQRLFRLINGHPNDSNYFAWQALRRRYQGPGDRCLPPYLQRSQFARMRNDAGLIIPVHASLRQFLEEPAGARGRCGRAAGFAGLDDGPMKSARCGTRSIVPAAIRCRDLPHRRRANRRWKARPRAVA